jgi:hypothetical protein
VKEREGVDEVGMRKLRLAASEARYVCISGCASSAEKYWFVSHREREAKPDGSMRRAIISQ